MLPLKEKTLALLIQLPPSLKITEGIENLREHIVHELDDRFRYAIEVRDRTWFQDLVIAIVSANNHYAGFGPGTANTFRRMVGLPEAQFSKDEENKKDEDDKRHLHSSSIQDPMQSTISDFMT
ncbi:MAG: DUF72 domain-containing protein [Nitrososphaeraceae archaeon]|nr:DUF72 domain-containing protein [Nitrososphaeraceae archaeon]